MFNFKELEELKKDYFVFSISKMDKENYQGYYSKICINLIAEHFFSGKVFECPYMENGNVIDRLYLISKDESKENN